MTQTAGPMYAVDELHRIGAKCPEKYLALLNAASDKGFVEGMDPWYFPRALPAYAEMCNKAAGRPVVPFSQALQEDMMACFEASAGEYPAVVVLDPWKPTAQHRIIRRLSDFDAWLKFAEQVTRNIEERDK